MKAVIDACVLYPTILREIVMGVARVGLLTPIWSERLLEEWTRTAARRGGPTDEIVARGEIALLNARFPDAMTRHDPAREGQLWLPDAGDIHVLATAEAARADTIVTLNLQDFPRAELLPFGLAAVHPDAVLYELWLSAPEPVAASVHATHRAAEANSGTPLSLKAMLKRSRLPRLAKAVTG